MSGNFFIAAATVAYSNRSQGRRKHFCGGQAKNTMGTNGVLARHEIFEFNFIHDYDVIIIGHERVERERALEQGYWHAIAADECLTRQREKKMAVISKKQIKPKETPLVL